MCEILIKVNCPHCQSSKVVKNGKKKNGTQNLLCRSCRRQFQPEYRRNKGADPAVRQLILRLLDRNSGIRDMGELLQVSRPCILSNLCRHGNRLTVKPLHKRYRLVQIDEVWGSVGKRKKGKHRLIYAYCPETDQIPAYSCGSRSAKTVKELHEKLQGVQIDEFCTDHWKAFASVLPADRHSIGKACINNIKGVNTCLRARNKGLVRKTTCFSKKKENHLAALNIMFNYQNKQKN